jgi:hypothetical protein
MVKKLQRSTIRGTLKLFFTHLRLREVSYSSEDIKISMEPVSGIEEMQRIEALTAACNLAAMMFQTGISMGIPPASWVPYILKDILKIPDESILQMQVDQEQIQQVQQMQADQEQGVEAGNPDAQKRAETREALKTQINEELQKSHYKGLKKFLATEADTDLSILVDDSEIFPKDFSKLSEHSPLE